MVRLLLLMLFGALISSNGALAEEGKFEEDTGEEDIENLVEDFVDNEAVDDAGTHTIIYRTSLVTAAHIQCSLHKANEDCYPKCGHKGGKCNHCGGGGYCCRKGYDDCPANIAMFAHANHHSCLRCKSKDEKNCNAGCPKGFLRGLDQKTCYDMNECSVGNGGCSHVCVNTKGSFTCQCPKGFKIGADKKTCEDVNECNVNRGGCNHFCTNTKGGYKCGCIQGFVLGKDGKTCQRNSGGGPADCRHGGVCSHTCNQVTGKCQCPSGYFLGADGETCSDNWWCPFAVGQSEVSTNDGKKKLVGYYDNDEECAKRCMHDKKKFEFINGVETMSEKNDLRSCYCVERMVYNKGPNFSKQNARSCFLIEKSDGHIEQGYTCDLQLGYADGDEHGKGKGMGGEEVGYYSPQDCVRQCLLRQKYQTNKDRHDSKINAITVWKGRCFCRENVRKIVPHETSNMKERKTCILKKKAAKDTTSYKNYKNKACSKDTQWQKLGCYKNIGKRSWPYNNWHYKPDKNDYDWVRRPSLVKGKLLIDWKNELDWSKHGDDVSLRKSLVCACSEAARSQGVNHIATQFSGECFAADFEDFTQVKQSIGCSATKANDVYHVYGVDHYKQDTGYSCALNPGRGEIGDGCYTSSGIPYPTGEDCIKHCAEIKRTGRAPNGRTDHCYKNINLVNFVGPLQAFRSCGCMVVKYIMKEKTADRSRHQCEGSCSLGIQACWLTKFDGTV